MWDARVSDAERAERIRQEQERARSRARLRDIRRRQAGNPLVAVYGAGPAGLTCKTCVQLVRVSYQDKAYYKCTLRGYSHGSGTDQRVGWTASGRYEAREGEIERVEVW
ncbi:MAG: hypothetical protein OJF49_000312 [Ktedonobacterales bacterium]|jgi:hypothetical protein|nr:MAG: hypothetical protein OJF49_000312 [Ktedonobacterales bacterium]